MDRPPGGGTLADMAVRAFDALIRALKQGELSPVYYLLGTEDVLKDEAIRQILDHALDPSLRDFNLDQRSAAALDAEDVRTLVATLPMMADRRVVILRDVEGWRKNAKGRSELLSYLKKPSSDTVLILVQGSAEGDTPDKEFVPRADTILCATLPVDRARKWAIHEAKGLGVTLTAEAAAHLVEAVGPDLGVLRSEVAKFGALPADTVLTPELVGDLVGVRHGETVNDWRVAVMNRDAARATGLLRAVLAQSGVSGVRLLMVLGTALIGTQYARSQRDRGTRGSRLEDACFNTLRKVRAFGIGDWKVEAASWARWSEQWTAREIDAAIRASLDCDRALKSTTLTDEYGLLLTLTLRLATAMERAA